MPNALKIVFDAPIALGWAVNELTSDLGIVAVLASSFFDGGGAAIGFGCGDRTAVGVCLIHGCCGILFTYDCLSGFIQIRTKR
jgi:hypothetical protein